jgi:hypothetical protein
MSSAAYPISEGLWQKFRQQALPPDLPDHQLIDLKVAFFAGVLGMAQVAHGAMQEQPILTVAETIQEILRENVVLTKEARPKR